MKNVKIKNLGRVLLLNILMKSEGNVLAIKQIRELIPKIAFSDDEQKEMGIEELPDKSIKWKSNKESSYDLSDSVYNIVKKELLNINNSGKVNFQILDFIEKILTKEDFDKLISEKKEEIKK